MEGIPNYGASHSRRHERMRAMITLKALHRIAFVAVLVGLAVASRPAQASITILDTQGFEVPLFTTTFDDGGMGYAGQLEGQPVTPESDTWAQSTDPGTSTATVQTAVVESGSQAVQLVRGADSNIRWGVPTSGYPLSQLDTITISWDMRVEGPAGDNMAGEFGPFFGTEAYADVAGGNTLLGSLGVDATTGEVLYQDTGTGDFVAPGPTVAFGAWNSFAILLDYAAQQYSVFLNNTLVAGGIGFVDGLFTTFSDAPISGLTAAAGSEDLTGTAYFDNFTITTNAVPETSTVVTWGLLAAMAVSGCWFKRHSLLQS